jgi:predicted O-methyltransferase YrrM
MSFARGRVNLRSGRARGEPRREGLAVRADLPSVAERTLMTARAKGAPASLAPTSGPRRLTCGRVPRVGPSLVEWPVVQALYHFVKWRLGLAAADRWMMPEEGACLLRHAAGRKRLAEIGVWEGGTTSRLREVMAHGATLVAIDPFPPGRLGISYQKLIAASEVGAVRNGTVVWLRQTGVEAARAPCVLAAPFDFVFVDADHTYEGLRGDWEGWSPLIESGGIIALHDSLMPEGHSDAGSIQYSNEVVAHDPRFETVDEVYSLRVLRRRAPRGVPAAVKDNGAGNQPSGPRDGRASR